MHQMHLLPLEQLARDTGCHNFVAVVVGERVVVISAVEQSKRAEEQGGGEEVR